jgi:hypothetical protein
MMNRQHSIIVTRWDVARAGLIVGCFVAGVALIGWAVGHGRS